MKVEDNKNKKLPRKLRKIIVEKKRRERIDTALKQLKDMLFGGSELQFQNDYMRMEKADILENVVKYLQSQHTKAPSGTCQSKGSCDAQYRLGYLQCVREVTRVMDSLCGANSQITHSLTHYLNIKISQLTSQYLSHDRLNPHTSPLLSQKPRDNIHAQKLHPECTSTTGIIPPQQRIPNLHPSQHSAFHPVQESSRAPVGSTDNISIAVYQHNHYNNYRNEKSNASDQSNINIRPVIKVEADSSSSNVNVSKSRRESLNDVNKNVHGHLNSAFIKQDAGMWRPW